MAERVKQYIDDKHSVGGSKREGNGTAWTMPWDQRMKAINEVLKRDPLGSPNTPDSAGRPREGTVHRVEDFEDDFLDELGFSEVGVAGRNQSEHPLYGVEVVLNPDGTLRDAYPYDISFGVR